MGISANKLVYDFQRKLNATVSSRNKNYRIVDIVSYLNEGLEIWYENKVFAAETNDKIKHDLRQFVVPKAELTCEEVDCDCCLAKFPDNYYKTLDIEVKVCNEECCPGIKKSICPKNPQFDDKNTNRKKGHWGADFKWEQLLYKEVSEGILIYHEGEMDVTSVCIDYYKKPQKIQAPELVDCSENSYLDWDNKLITINADFEVDSTFGNRQVSDIAVLNAERDSGNIQQYQTQLQKILQLDTLYR